MNVDELRAEMKRKFTAISLREWCRLTGCASSHVHEFVNGKKGPPSDMLRALNLEVRYIRMSLARRQADAPESSSSTPPTNKDQVR